MGSVSRYAAAAAAAAVLVALSSGSDALGALPGQAMVLEHWGGTAWSQRFAPQLARGGSSLSAVTALSGSDVWAVGSGVRLQGNQGYPLAEHWTGSSWHPMALPVPKKNVFGIDLVGVAGSSANNVWAVGVAPSGPLFEHWNGRSWRLRSNKTAFTPAGVAVASARAAWAVGSYVGKRNRTRMRIMRWNGSSWRSVATTLRPRGRGGYDELFGVSALSARSVWAVGDYKRGAAIQALFVHWDGTSWKRVRSPNPGQGLNSVRSVVALGPRNVWAVGKYRGGQQQKPLVMHWDGRRWKVVPAPGTSPTASYDVLNAVAAASPRDIWAVGASSSGGPAQSFSEHWDGTSWKVVPMPDQPPPYVGLNGVAAVSAHNAWAVGVYTAA